MNSPEQQILEPEQSSKAKSWLSDAREHISSDALASDAEKGYYLQYLAVAEQLASILPEFQHELARLQDVRDSADFDIFSLQVSVLPNAVDKLRIAIRNSGLEVDSTSVHA